MDISDNKKRTNKGYSFSLVYGTEAVLPLEIAVPSVRIALKSNIDPDARYQQLEELDERRETSQAILRAYHAKLSRAHDLMVKERKFKEGDLVLKNAPHVLRGLNPPNKFAPKWEGPYIVAKANESGYYFLADIDNGSPLRSPINGKWLKLYYP